MLLNEHQSKVLFSEAGIPVPAGTMVRAHETGSASIPFPTPWFLKAQVLTGGRGKAGGILRVDREDDFQATADKIFSISFKGESPAFLRVEPAQNIAREMYVSLSVSRPLGSVVLTVGREGGVEIENLGRDNLLIQKVSPTKGLAPNQIRAAFFHLGLDRELLAPFADLLSKLHAAFVDNGLLLAEVNPLVLTTEGQFLALDGKVEIDDNKVDISPDLNKHYHPEHKSAEENTARDAGLSFVPLSGWVGLMVNGAGLAMTTMDLLNYSGVPAANFLDLGGGANQERMETAFSLLFGDKQVGVLFINLFGGILSCEKVALAMRAALGGNEPPKPMVVRMAGFGSKQGMAILRDMGCDNIHVVQGMAQALETIEALRPEGAPSVDFPLESTEMKDVSFDTTDKSAPRPFPIGKDTPVLVQGITGREGRLHTARMLEYGANIVAGVTPFKGGQEVEGVPVYNSVSEALKNHEVRASIIFVPPKMAPDAILEAAGNEIDWAICITEGIPQQDMLAVMDQIKNSPTRLVGPNTPGLIIPGRTKIGILPPQPFTPGPVAVISRSGTLTYEAAQRLTDAGIGQSMCMGIGGDPFIGTTFKDVFEMLANDPTTEAVLVLGEIGGQAEEDLARYVLESGFSKPVTAFIAGRTAPPGKRLGHAGAILEGEGGTSSKLNTMAGAGFTVCASLSEVAGAVAECLAKD